MNERIKELVKNAGLPIDGFGYPIWGCLEGEDAKKEFLEKFAELIVKECMLQCHHNDDMDRIEKHFGVEE